MSTEPKKSLPRIRTFAQDLEIEREKHHLPPSATVNSVPKVDATVVAGKPVIDTPTIPVVETKTPPTEPSIVVQSSSTKTKPEPTQPDAHAPTIKISVRNRKPDLKAVRTETGGTVITDNKKTTPGFFASVFDSLNTWLNANKKKRAETPKYTVIDSERRKGVIQKATTKSGSIFTADSETLAEEVRRRQSNDIPSKNASETDISWTPNTEPGYPLLTGATTNVTVEFKKRSIPEPIMVEPVVIQTPPPPLVVREKVAKPEKVVEPEITIAEPVVIPPPEIVTPREVPSWATQSSIESQDPAIEPESTDIAVVSPLLQTNDTEEPLYELTTPEAHYKIRSIGDVAKINTNSLSLGVVGAVAGLVVLIFIIRTLFTFVTDSNPLVTLEAAKPLLEKATVIDTEISIQSNDALLIALSQTDTDLPGTRELRLIMNDSSIITKDGTAAMAGLSGSSRFVQTATDIRFAHIGTKRGIIAKVSDPTNALGTLLEWEPTIASALAPLFGTPLPASPVTFTDERLEGVDVRVATLDNGGYVVYGFIDQNTIVITESTTAFTEALASN